MEAQESAVAQATEGAVQPTVTAPFLGNECPCVKRHSPRPERIEKHHVYPQGEQVKRHGAVRDRFTQNLCDTGHASVHIGINRLRDGEAMNLGNRNLEAVARAGHESIEAGQRVEIRWPS